MDKKVSKFMSYNKVQDRVEGILRKVKLPCVLLEHSYSRNDFICESFFKYKLKDDLEVVTLVLSESRYKANVTVTITYTDLGTMPIKKYVVVKEEFNDDDVATVLNTLLCLYDSRYLEDKKRRNFINYVKRLYVACDIKYLKASKTDITHNGLYIYGEYRNVPCRICISSSTGTLTANMTMMFGIRDNKNTEHTVSLLGDCVSKDSKAIKCLLKQYIL